MPKIEKTAEKERSRRILTFDILRGYFLCVILFNHLQYYPNGFDLLTGRGILYASTAEGFFVVSGIVLGIVRGQKLLNLPFRESAKLLWKRALQLYLASIILTFIFTVIGQAFIANPGIKYGIFTEWNQWWELIWHTVTLSYTYGWADFLRLYAVFIFFAPLALWLLRKGLWYVVFAISAVVWMLYPLFAADTNFAQLLSWQFIFFSGFIIGFHWNVITNAWRSLSTKVRTIIGWSFVGLFIISVAASFALVFGHELGNALGNQLTTLHHEVEQSFNKDRLPVGRLIIGTIWFWGLFFIVRRFEPFILKYTGWLFLRFGMNSLYVYTISAFIVFFAHLIITPPGTGSLFLNFLVSIAMLALVQVAVRTKFLMKIIPR